MRRTVKNFAKLIKKKEAVTWEHLKFVEKQYGNNSMETQKALGEWCAFNYVKGLLNSKDLFDKVWDIWMDD